VGRVGRACQDTYPKTLSRMSRDLERVYSRTKAGITCFRPTRLLQLLWTPGSVSQLVDVGRRGQQRELSGGGGQHFASSTQNLRPLKRSLREDLLILVVKQQPVSRLGLGICTGRQTASLSSSCSRTQEEVSMGQPAAARKSKLSHVFEFSCQARSWSTAV